MRPLFIISGLKGQLILAQWQRLGRKMGHGISSTLKGQLNEIVAELPFQGAGRYPASFSNAPLRLRWAELNWPFRPPKVKSRTKILLDNTLITCTRK